MLSHRPAGEADLAQICGLVHSAEELYYFHPRARFPLTAEQVRDAIAQRRDSTIVLLDDRVAGFANLVQVNEGGCCAIGNVVVGPEYRGRGVGRYLLELMIRLARERHRATRVEVDCFSDNVAGLLLYTKLGFRPDRVEMRHGPDGRRRALIRMVLEPQT